MSVEDILEELINTDQEETTKSKKETYENIGTDTTPMLMIAFD